jgi:hypothetical protein
MQTAFFDWVRLNLQYCRNPELKKAFGLCYAVPNGGAFRQVLDKNTGKWWSPEGKRMKAEGMTAGILDVNLDVSSYGWAGTDGNLYTTHDSLKPIYDELFEDEVELHGLRIEHKHRANISPKIQAKIDTGNYIVDLSPEQKEKRELLIEAGHKVVVSYSVKQSVKAFFDYLPFEEKDYQGIREYLG